MKETVNILTQIEAILKKDWAAGSHEVIPSLENIIYFQDGEYKFEKRNINYPPSLYKIFDEVLVNAADHKINNPMSVKCIDIKFNEKTGEIAVYNDGPGIHVRKHTVKTDKYIPEMIFGMLNCGTNIEKTVESITGGTNGIGAKLCNILSTEYSVETMDEKSGLFYQQKWNDNMKICHRPLLFKFTKNRLTKFEKHRRVPHTLIKFIPKYNHFGGYSEFNSEVYNSLNDLFLTRAILLSAYVGMSNSYNKKIPICNVIFNGKTLPFHNMTDIASIIYKNVTTYTTIINPNKDNVVKNQQHPWEICIVPIQNNNKQHLTNINGIVVQSGNVINYINDELYNGIKDIIVNKFKKNKNIKFSKSLVANNVIILLNAKVAGVSWNGQRKDNVLINKCKLKGHTFDIAFLKQIADVLYDKIIENLLVNKKPSSVRGPKNYYEKYTAAKWAGGTKSSQCSLLLAEGDSACEMCRYGITLEDKHTKKHILGFEKYGLFTLGGVIINARKECNIIITKLGTVKYDMKNKLKNNKFFKAFIDILGLNLDYKYDPNSQQYKKEISYLRYGCIIACVDQDHDGVGQIFSLIINLFNLFWPNLLNNGFVKRFVTPIQRAFGPKREVKSFFSEHEYEKWASGVENVSKWKIKYYKGLATHEESMHSNMFRNFNKNLYTYFPEIDTDKYFEIYYGTDPDKRKIELATPIEHLSEDKISKQLKNKLISCSDHLRIESKAHKQENINQKLWCAIDGMNNSSHKIFNAALNSTIDLVKGIRVSQFAGLISKSEHYHHGEESLQKSIIRKGFLDVGGVQLPQFIPISAKFNFGTRSGSKPAQARYIHVAFNAKLMHLIFPKTDYYLLTSTFDEGERSEPKFFVPIIPMATVESIKMPADGWKIETHGRDIFQVIYNVRRLIKFGESIELLPMDPDTRGFKGEIKFIKGKMCSVGNYYYDTKTNTVHITELPLRVWTNTYIARIEKKAGIIRKKTGTKSVDIESKSKRGTEEKSTIIHSIVDRSGINGINIEIKLKENAHLLLEEMNDSIWTDGFEEYFELKSKFINNLNMIGINGEVIEFNNYMDIIKYWFPIRKHYYELRIKRDLILLNLKILKITEVIRYIDELPKLNISKMDESDAIKCLQDNNYTNIDNKLLSNPKYTHCDDLKKMILNGKNSSYSYLLDNLSDRDKLSNSINKRQIKLDELNDKLHNLKLISNEGEFRGAKIWLNELDELESVIKLGLSTNWSYKKNITYKFS